MRKRVIMFNKLSRFFTSLTTKYLPDAYVFALLLTLIVFVLGLVVQNKSLTDMLVYWGDGFWNLLAFSMQMALVLITGFTMAKTPVVSKVINFLCLFVTDFKRGVIFTVIISCLACYINWGFGLIVSALFAVAVAKKIKKLDYGLLVAMSYSGFLVWHGGLSGSVPLKLTDPSTKIKNIIGEKTFALNETLYSNLNLTMLSLTVFLLLILGFLFASQTTNIQPIEFKEESEKPVNDQDQSIASVIERSRLLAIVIGLMGISYLVIKLIQGSSFNLNLMIFLFLCLGIILHQNSKRFLIAFNDSVKDSSGILLQFPFYAGIMGMMASSGLAQSLSEFFISISTNDTFLIFTYWSAGIVNFFVPSGGGQWAIQGPIILPAAKELGVNLADAAMAIAWGDAWSNMLQPFWAIPLLSVAKLKLNQMMGYSIIIFLVIGLFSSFVFYIFA